MNSHYDLIILGGGCAGLSLGMRLAEYGSLAPKTLVLEKRAEYVNDRTWCFWDVADVELSEWTEHSWPTFKVRKGNLHFTKSCSENRYLMMSATAFYRNAIAKITLNEQQTTLMTDQAVVEVHKAEKHWCITTKNATYTTSKVVDTRPSYNMQDEDSTLWQSFLGYEIETNTDLFDVNQFTLMDADDTFKHGLGFIYVLPFSKRRALIEYTVFSSTAFSAERLEQHIEPALVRYVRNTDYSIIRTEFGQLPMGNQKIKTTNDDTYIYAGLYAGAAKPSSGYAFQRIQRWAKMCSAEIINKKSLNGQEKDPLVLATLDSIFLHVLKSHPNKSATLFFNFFLKCKSITIIRFLSDYANVTDLLSIILSMPKLLFLKSLPAYAFRRVFNKR